MAKQRPSKPRIPAKPKRPPARLVSDESERAGRAGRTVSPKRETVPEPTPVEIPPAAAAQIEQPISVPSVTTLLWLRLLVALGVVMTIAAVWLYVQLSPLRTEIADRDKTIGSLQARITKLDSDAKPKDEFLRILNAPRVSVVKLSGTQAYAHAQGIIVWDPATKMAILHVSNLPPTPADKEYQLWTIKRKKLKPAGVFSVGSPTEEAGLLSVIALATVEKKEADAVVVTLGPKGGSQQKTGPIYMVGAISVK
ncbi:MAG: anti-sigma factor [Ignavibacteriales bacterium]|nr:anti-sigma factor [Ignavibacteriales bacterium]